MSKRTRRTFSQEFKQQIVNLYLAGKPRVEIIREYELTASAFDKIGKSNLKRVVHSKKKIILRLNKKNC